MEKDSKGWIYLSDLDMSIKLSREVQRIIVEHGDMGYKRKYLNRKKTKPTEVKFWNFWNVTAHELQELLQPVFVKYPWIISLKVTHNSPAQDTLALGVGGYVISARFEITSGRFYTRRDFMK